MAHAPSPPLEAPEPLSAGSGSDVALATRAGTGIAASAAGTGRQGRPWTSASTGAAPSAPVGGSLNTAGGNAAAAGTAAGGSGGGGGGGSSLPMGLIGPAPLWSISPRFLPLSMDRSASQPAALQDLAAAGSPISDPALQSLVGLNPS